MNTKTSKAIFLINEQYRDQVERAKKQLLLIFGLCVEGQKSGLDEFSQSQDYGFGRGSVVRTDIGRIKCILRVCLRGGYIGKIQQRYFLRLPFSSIAKFRPMKEILLLKYLVKNDIAVPTPVVSGVICSIFGLWYQGFLVTEEIQDSKNLLDLGVAVTTCANEKDEFTQACYQAGRCARKMLDVSVHHPDLHLGNVLWKDGQQAYLIDFDKAFVFSAEGHRKRYREQIKKRWQRSAKKHGLEAFAVEPFFRGLEDL